MGGGFVKLHRDAMDHAVFQDEWLWKLFTWCLMKANFRDFDSARGLIPRGSFSMGRIQAADELHTSPSRVYRGLAKLQSLGSITLKSNSAFTVVTVCNYETYQPSDSDTRTTNEQRTDSERTADEQRADTSRRRQEGKKGRSNKAPRVSLEDALKTCEKVHLEISPVWHQWLTYKYEQGEGYAETGLKSAVTILANKIAAHGVPAVADAMLRSMASGYKGWEWVFDGKPVAKSSPPLPVTNQPVPTKVKPVDWTNAAAP